MSHVMTPQAMKALVGKHFGTSEWFDITQERVDKFAAATEDFQLIHNDPEEASKTQFGGTIAHGFLTLSLLPAMMKKSDLPLTEGVKTGFNYGGNKTRFISPVHVGKRVRGLFKLLALEEKRPGQWQHTVELTVEIEGEDKPALICEWITLSFV